MQRVTYPKPQLVKSWTQSTSERLVNPSPTPTPSSMCKLNDHGRCLHRNASLNWLILGFVQMYLDLGPGRSWWEPCLGSSGRLPQVWGWREGLRSKSDVSQLSSGPSGPSSSREGRSLTAERSLDDSCLLCHQTGAESSWYPRAYHLHLTVLTSGFTASTSNRRWMSRWAMTSERLRCWWLVFFSLFSFFFSDPPNSYV